VIWNINDQMSLHAYLNRKGCPPGEKGRPRKWGSVGGGGGKGVSKAAKNVEETVKTQVAGI